MSPEIGVAVVTAMLAIHVTGDSDPNGMLRGVYLYLTLFAGRTGATGHAGNKGEFCLCVCV